MKIRVLGLLMMLGLASPFAAFAMPYAGPYSGPQQFQDPGSLLRDRLDKLIGFLGQGSAQGRDRQQLVAFVESEVAPYFDFEYMAQWVAGPMSRSMSEEQASALEDKLRSMFLQAMVKELSSYSHGRIQYLRPRGNPSRGEMRLGIRAFPYGGQGYPTQIDFRVYHSKDGWKVFDVIANGQSVVAHYRNYFAQNAQWQRPRPQRGFGPAVYPIRNR